MIHEEKFSATADRSKDSSLTGQVKIVRATSGDLLSNSVTDVAIFDVATALHLIRELSRAVQHAIDGRGR